MVLNRQFNYLDNLLIREVGMIEKIQNIHLEQ